MSKHLNRRSFLKQTAVAAGALSAVQYFAAPSILNAANAGNKVRCAVIGCGGRGMQAHIPAAAPEQLVAIADPLEIQHEVVRKYLANKNIEAKGLQTFVDYRKMFDKVAKQIDAVFIAAPNHHHAPAAIMAMQLGLNVYCEKPVCHDVAEARRMRDMAAKTKVATQVGNQGHCMDGYRKLCEYIWSGAIGNVTETHSWTNRANGGEGPRPKAEKPPAGMHWDEWIGAAPYREYHEDLHPHEWHGWYDFGNGSIGNMGCHVLDGLFWSLKIEHPTSIEVENMSGGSSERYPLGSRVRWDVPARAGMPAVKVYWYEGLRPGAKGGKFGKNHTVLGDDRNFPPLMQEIRAKYPDEELDKGDSGTIYVGDKGMIFTGTYGDKMHILPWEKMKATPEPAKTLPRIEKESIFNNFLDAVRAGKTETAVSFDYGTRLTEFAILGNLAMHAGQGKKVMWDGPNMRVTNLPELNAWVKREYRKGWQV